MARSANGYPVLLTGLDRARVVVVGGGVVAARRVAALLEAGARPRVIAPTLEPTLERLAADGRIEHRARRYRRGDLRGATLAVVASGDPAVQRAARREAARHRVILNDAAPAPGSTPLARSADAPAALRRGPLLAAIGSGGRSPVLSALLRERLGASLPAWLEAFLASDEALRLRALPTEIQRAWWRRALRDRVDPPPLPAAATDERSPA